jgi:outer membrane immunogenic protein
MLGRLFGAAVAICASTASVVADEPHLNWSGFYAGATVGYGWTDGRFIGAEDGFLVTSHQDVSGAAFGAFVGAQRQLANDVVVGVETDILYRTGKGSDNLDFNILPAWFDGDQLVTDVKWTGSLRARLGYAAGSWLPYVTGGVAWAKYSVDYRDADRKSFFPPIPIEVFHHNENTIGWTLGAGSEYALSEDILLRAEYRYSDFGDGSVSLATFNIDSAFELESHDVMLGIGYRF